MQIDNIMVISSSGIKSQINKYRSVPTIQPIQTIPAHVAIIEHPRLPAHVAISQLLAHASDFQTLTKSTIITPSTIRLDYAQHLVTTYKMSNRVVIPINTEVMTLHV